MKIILLKDDKMLGKAGDIVEAKDGYARNYLLPKKIAVLANDENLEKLKEQKRIEKEKEDENIAKANEIKKTIEKKEITLKAKGGDGKLFGAITSKDISDKIKDVFKIDIDKKKISLNENIKEVGIKTINIKLYKNVIAKLKVNIEAI